MVSFAEQDSSVWDKELYVWKVQILADANVGLELIHACGQVARKGLS